MRIWRGTGYLVLLGALLAPASMGKGYVRWTESSVPPVKILGVSDLVIPWGDAANSLVEAAKKQGYRVYLEATAEQATAAAEAGSKAGIAGIILQGDAAETGKLEESERKLQAAYPKLKILMLDAGG